MQVGDPFTEKLLIEACLELMATDAIVAIQDMGAAGLTSSSVEMAAKGGVGIELDLDKVPLRETGMTAYEIMLSESQERMLMVLKPGREDDALQDLREVGPRLRRHRPRSPTPAAWCCKMARRGSWPTSRSRRWSTARPSTSGRGRRRRLPPGARRRRACRRRSRSARSLQQLMGCPDLASQALDLGAVRPPGHGRHRDPPAAATPRVVRVHGSAQGRWRMTSDCTPRYCHADPETGGKQAVAEAWRNLTAVGATPLAITDNLNFGNPETPRDHGPVRRLHRGHGGGLPALDFPVVSGNVSLYNETDGNGRSCRRPRSAASA